MANYMAACRTNYFRVTDEEKYQKLFSGLCGEDTIHDFTETDEEGITRHGFGCYGTLFWSDPDEEWEDGFDSFCEKLREILPEDEAFIYLESGNEKLRYVIGAYTVVTREEVKWGEISNLAIETAKQIIGPDYSTQTDY